MGKKYEIKRYEQCRYQWAKKKPHKGLVIRRVILAREFV